MIDFREVNRLALTRLVRGFEQKRGGAIALREATRHGLVGEIQRLLDSGVDVNARTDRGLTPLMFAYDAKIGELLIRHGADVNARDDQGNTPLIWFLRALAKKGAAEKYLRLLVSAGADVSMKSSDGRSAYSLAEEKYGREIAKLLKPE
jgi:uncharacterized protein